MKSDLTNEEVPEQYLRRTLDGYNVETKIYNRTARLLRCTFVSLYDIVHVQEELDKYREVLNEISFTVRKYIQFCNTDFKGVIKELINLENEYAISLYNKHRCCLNIHEHTSIIQAIRGLYLVSKDFKLDGNKRSSSTPDFLREYLKDLEVKL